ncbi:MAG: FIST C-terminal domain-containing protein [Candidatus Krumholzibacteriia bacterium]
MRWTSSLSLQKEPLVAAREAAMACARDLQWEDPDLAVVFFTREFVPYADEIAQALLQTLPARRLLGCCGGGVIGGGREVEQGPALTIAAARLPGVEVTPFRVTGDELPDADASPRAWSTAIGVPAEPVPHLLMLADPHTFPEPHLLAGLDFAYAGGVKLGGLASGARQPGGNVLILEGEVFRDGLVGLGLSGALRLDAIVAQGCRPIGPILQVTRSQGHILLGLNDRSALEAVHEVLSELDTDERRLARNSLHLGVHMDPLSGDPHRGDFLIRNLAGIDPGTGAILVGDELREGQTVQLHVRDAGSSRQDLELLLDRYVQLPRPGPPRGALLFSCLGRGRHLYGEPDHDLRLVRAKLGRIPLGGFFCNGEIGPVGSTTYLHGFTSSIGLFSAALPE